MFIFSFLGKHSRKYCGCASPDNVAEEDLLIVAEDVLLVAVGHHQAIAKAVREATPCSSSRIPSPVDRTFVNRDAELKDSEETRIRNKFFPSTGEINVPPLQALSPSAHGIHSSGDRIIKVVRGDITTTIWWRMQG